MAEEKKKRRKLFEFSADVMRVTLLIVGSVISTAVLTLAILAIMELSKENLQTASNYLLGVFIVLGLSRLITFFKEKTKMALIRFLSLFI